VRCARDLNRRRTAAVCWRHETFRNSGTRAAFVKALASLGVPYRKLNIAIELPSNEAVLAAVLAGAGATILSARVCADALKAGSLKRLPVSLTPRPFCAVQHADRYRSRAVSALLEILRTHARS